MCFDDLKSIIKSIKVFFHTFFSCDLDIKNDDPSQKPRAETFNDDVDNKVNRLKYLVINTFEVVSTSIFRCHACNIGIPLLKLKQN